MACMKADNPGFKSLLDRAGITKAELARAIGVRPYTVSRWASADSLPRYAMAFLQERVKTRTLAEEVLGLRSALPKDT